MGRCSTISGSAGGLIDYAESEALLRRTSSTPRSPLLRKLLSPSTETWLRAHTLSPAEQHI
jgi:hypothetical protein